MVYKTVSIWSAPREEDKAEFETYYQTTHVVLASQIPHATRLVLTAVDDVSGAEASDFYRVAEMWFEDEESFRLAMISPQSLATSEDSAKMRARFGVTMRRAVGTAVVMPMNIAK